MSEQSPIFVKTETFMVWLLEHTAKFPKHERFRLAKRIEDAAFGLHECLLLAINHKDRQTYYLLRANIELDKLRFYMRLAMEAKHTTYQQFGYAAQQLTEIGKILGSWRKKSAL